MLRTKELKNEEEFKKIFISPDLTSKQQEIDKNLRLEVRKFRGNGESGAKIQAGKVVKNTNGRQTVVLHEPPK